MKSATNQSVNPKMIKALRKKLDLSQQEIAFLLDSERAEISKVERGLTTPNWLVKFVTLSRLLAEAGMTWEDVIMEFPEITDRKAS
jgi:transcriptional regulator with XRE-family HTH domain